MQSSYTPEQEAQLTRWGCPEADLMVIDPATIKTRSEDVRCARQPHEVLAWLVGVTGRDIALVCRRAANDFDPAGYSASAGGDYGSAFERDDDWPTVYPAPHAATFALAQAVMEAK